MIGLLCVSAALTYGAWQRGWIGAPDVSLPEHLDKLEPDVRALIERQVDRARHAPRNPEAHGELGLAYEANELWVEARKAFATAADLSNNDPLWRLHWAVTTHQAGDAERALTILTQLVKDAPDLAAAQHRYGQRMLEQNNLEAAEAALTKTVKLAPQAAPGYASLAELRLRQQRTGEAVELLEKALKLDGSYRVAHFLLGTAYRQLRRMDDAERELELGQKAEIRYVLDELTQRTEHFAVTARARHARGVRLMTAGKYAQAAISLAAAHRADPQDVAIINALAGALMQNNRIAEAFTLLQKAKSLDDRHATTYVNLASWYLFSGKLDEALQHARGGIERSPTNPTAHAVYIQTLMQLHRRDEARQALQEALVVLPRDPNLRQLAKQLP